MNVAKKRDVRYLAAAVLLYAVIIAAVIIMYKCVQMTVLQARILQNAAYVILLLVTLLFMKLTGKALKDFGLFFGKLHIQIGIGAASGAVIMLFALVFGRIPSFPEEFIYMLSSQFLVAAAEEMFFRGFVLKMSRDIFGSKDTAVFISAALFSLSHFPLGGNLGQLIFTFVTGILFAVLRTEFDDTVGLPATVTAHLLINVF